MHSTSTIYSLNNLGIRQEIAAKPIRKNRFSFLNYSGKINFQIHKKPENSIRVLKVFGKFDSHYAGEVTHKSVHGKVLGKTQHSFLAQHFETPS